MCAAAHRVLDSPLERRCGAIVTGVHLDYAVPAVLLGGKIRGTRRRTCGLAADFHGIVPKLIRHTMNSRPRKHIRHGGGAHCSDMGERRLAHAGSPAEQKEPALRTAWKCGRRAGERVSNDRPSALPKGMTIRECLVAAPRAPSWPILGRASSARFIAACLAHSL